MSLSPTPTKPIITEKGDRLPAVFQSWFGSIQQWLGPQGQTGTTAKRPTTNLWIGLCYYDTTLGYPVFVHQISPSIVWHNAAGAAV